MEISRVPKEHARMASHRGAPARRAWPFTHEIPVESISSVKRKLISAVQAAYCIAHRNIVNPFGKDLTVVYGCSGPDIITPLLSTDAKRIVCLDILRVHAGDQSPEDALEEWGRYADPSVAREIKYAKQLRLQDHFWLGEQVDFHLERLIAEELKALGVNRKSVKISRPAEGRTDIRFKWAYPGCQPRERIVSYYKTDIMHTSSYPEAVNALIRSGYDVYYQKAAMKCINSMDAYLPYVIGGARECLLISPTPGSDQDSSLDQRARDFLSQRYHYLSHINKEYVQLFMEAQISTFEPNFYGWYMELWVKAGG